MPNRVDKLTEVCHPQENLLRSNATPVVATKDALLNDYSQITKFRKIIILTEGCSNPALAKTAISLLRYRQDDILAVLDASQSGKTANAVFGVGGATPVISMLAQIA